MSQTPNALHNHHDGANRQNDSIDDSSSQLMVLLLQHPREAQRQGAAQIVERLTHNSH